jgi:hypothetical protein
VGILWLLVALAAVTSGRWWTAALWSLVAFAAARQVVLAWARQGSADAATISAHSAAALAGAGAVAITAAAAYSTGLAGVVLTALALTSAVALTAGGSRRRSAAPVVVGMLLPALAAASVVLAVRINLWVGLFLVLAVSLYDAGSFVFGAEAVGRWEGPVGGVIGVLAVTFTMSAIQIPPFDTITAWITGLLAAVGCVLGQWVVSSLLPEPGSRAPAMRRLDAYVVAAPVFVGCAWLLGG